MLSEIWCIEYRNTRLSLGLTMVTHRDVTLWFYACMMSVFTDSCVLQYPENHLDFFLLTIIRKTATFLE